MDRHWAEEGGYDRPIVGEDTPGMRFRAGGLIMAVGSSDLYEYGEAADDHEVRGSR